jgi:polyisoprenoid-binding protein YceI
MQTNRADTKTTPQLGRYEIDTGGSAVTFRTRHLFGLVPVRGTFAIRTAAIDIAEPLSRSSIRVEIEATSFQSGNEQRDASVRSGRFLDAGRYPVLTFTSGELDRAVINGMLTVRDVTRPVSLAIEETAASPRSFTARATTRIDRTDFGLVAARGLAGRYLDLSMEVRCVRK